MNSKEIKFIDNISIRGLWNRFDVSWQLNQDVNILVGENGTGKSTILRGVVDFFESINDISKGQKVHQNDKIKTLNIKYNHQEEKIIFNVTNDEYSPLISIYIDKEEQLDYSNTTILGERKKELCERFYKNYKPSFITTFDVKSKVGENLLNETIDSLEKEFIAYRFKKLRSLVQNQEALKGEFFFYETINRLFESTGKQLDRNDEKLSFTVDEKMLHWSELSSGEKQLLIILLTILCQDENPSILMMDEPEISLHLLWQYELIEIVRTLNPNCQLIIVTHSPSIFGKGWRDKVTLIKEIKEIIKNTDDVLPF
jgi:ABC-type cobalamin/Fe3+-siderophores transport system ATPase subunit